jgi:hypothetical protein
MVIASPSVRKLEFAMSLIMLVLATGEGVAQTVVRLPFGPAPKPVDAIAGILKALDEYSLVALGELHGVVEQAEFIAELIRHPEFAKKVDDIVLEAAGALHQDTIDRYVSGESVSLDELRKVWRDHTCAALGPRDSPNVELLFATVRAVNAALPRDRRLRVLAGDPPIDWQQVKDRADVGHWLAQRDTHYAQVVIDEVLRKNRKALLIIGGAHLSRRPLPDADPKKGVMLQIVESQFPRQTFKVTLHEGLGGPSAQAETQMAAWPKPSLAFVRGTWLESVLGADGPDAYLWLGRRDELTMERRPVELYRDAKYVEELDRRARIAGRPLDRQELSKARPKKWADNFPSGDIFVPIKRPPTGLQTKRIEKPLATKKE